MINGEGTGSFALTLNTPNGNSVPDAGSTMMMLVMAFGVIGGIRSRLS